VPGMTALAGAADTHRAPKVLRCLLPSRELIKPLHSTIYGQVGLQPLWNEREEPSK